MPLRGEACVVRCGRAAEPGREPLMSAPCPASDACSDAEVRAAPVAGLEPGTAGGLVPPGLPRRAWMEPPKRAAACELGNEGWPLCSPPGSDRSAIHLAWHCSALMPGICLATLSQRSGFFSTVLMPRYWSSTFVRRIAS